MTNRVETLTAGHSDDQPRQPAPTGKSTKTKPEPERLPWFDQWRGARGPALRSVLVTIRDALDKHEKTAGDRKRARRPDDQRRYQIAVETVVAIDELRCLDVIDGDLGLVPMWMTKFCCLALSSFRPHADC